MTLPSDNAAMAATRRAAHLTAATNACLARYDTELAEIIALRADGLAGAFIAFCARLATDECATELDRLHGRFGEAS